MKAGSKPAVMQTPGGALVVRATVVPRHANQKELDDYLAREQSITRPDKDPRLNHLHRVTTRKQHWPELCAYSPFGPRKATADIANEVGANQGAIP